MIIKVDLQCTSCYNKIKKILCKFPQIRDQVYDEKKNTVTITVICCSPEKIRDKLCCKGGKSIKSIEIEEPEKKKDEPKKSSPSDQKAVDKLPKEAAANPNKPTPPPPAYTPAGYWIGVCCGPCYEGILPLPPPPPPPPPPCYPPIIRPCYCYGRPCYMTGCDCSYTVDNPLACTIM
ncbi:protein PYRICULARIA ORYZAE RESISTANCE 21-like [Cornus florida]|uniref:protein PYRICULARIA ORYZAE RESISTANCE 21-like n=1 Tax=Cornus florida TaxID=4283 RepID=UPI0028984767|nr:protein PYRICULARIA ORYZAE RESISTANCE 21-like [Cornus florida]